MDKISLITVYPEIILLVMACAIALIDLFVRSPRRGPTYLLTMATLLSVAAIQAVYASGNQTLYGFGNLVVSDPMANWLKCFAALAMAATLVYARPYAADRDMLRGGELFTLGLFSLLGIFIMISATISW
jgi:NADH-quinone oxidoreductase subunit N